MSTINYELVYKVRRKGLKTDSHQNLRVGYANKAYAEADKVHQAYLEFLSKELGHTDFEVTSEACMADGIIGHVFVGTAQKGMGKRKCCFCGLDDFDGY